MQVVYLHGLGSSGQTMTAQRLQRSLPNNYHVIAPDIPIQPELAVTELRKLAATLKPDAVIVGTSMGAMYAQMFRGFRRILINPSFHTSEHIKLNLGRRVPFNSPRLDGAKDYEVTPKLVKKVEKLEARQFDPKFSITDRNDDDPARVFAFFGTRDNVVDCKDEYLRHYSQYADFDGEHRLDPNTTITLIVPKIIETSN